MPALVPGLATERKRPERREADERHFRCESLSKEIVVLAHYRISFWFAVIARLLLIVSH